MKQRIPQYMLCIFAINVRLYDLQLCLPTQFKHRDLLCHLRKHISILTCLCLMYN